MILKTIIILIVYNEICECQKTYENYTLYRAIPVNEQQLKYLETLQELFDVQMWKPPGLILRSVDFTISPSDKENFLAQANLSDMYLTTITSNVQELFNQQTVTPYIRRQMSSFNWHNFFRTDDIYEWLNDLSTTYTSILKMFSIGTTFEKRPIYAIQIKHSTHLNPDKRSTVIVEGGIHAREWISTAFVTYLIYKVLHAPQDTDDEFKRIAFAYNWVFVPLLNPDGYEYSHKQDRLWRKNRKNYHGVDINRNFDVGFGSVGVSSYTSSDIYNGEHAFSEAESRAIKLVVDQYKDSLKFYLAFHSYGQYIILPYAHLQEHVLNYDEVEEVAKNVAGRIKRRYGTLYTIGTAHDTVGYLTSGVSGCWVKQTYNVPYVITFELRDEGQEGFALSPKQIIPTCKETVDGIIELLTPKKKKTRAKFDDANDGASGTRFLKNIVLFINFILFITLCFDYSLAFNYSSFCMLSYI